MLVGNRFLKESDTVFFSERVPLIEFIGFQIMFLARLEGAPLSKAYTPYVVEGGRPITQSKNFIWKTIGKESKSADDF